MLRSEAKEILSRGWLASATEGDRQVTCYSNGYHCSSWNRFDPEFTTLNLDEALDYLYH